MSDSLPIERLHHVAVVASDPVASAKFYAEVLGFRPLVRPPFAFRGAWLFNFGLQIHIIERREPLVGSPPLLDTRANHLAFAVSDLAPVRQQLTARGVAYHEQVNAGNIHQIFFQDPDGHTIEVAVYPANPPFLTEAN